MRWRRLQPFTPSQRGSINGLGERSRGVSDRCDGVLGPNELAFVIEVEHDRRNGCVRADPVNKPVLAPVLILAPACVEPRAE